ncbi:unnamed protein product [Acanthoscelides obtectus]|uniref:Uncharacterized protein n=1 Tax=Acanthoscelides obtectus TaxID=200917 RepID=A0A9P0KG60_ACAOB|nr:unnamed protein product [Acanthoscelides obtectus]CAK1670267.1 hypothetical protein AOBTE_LOCUS27519 [Acanthoscelides obtectus]
MKIKEAIKASRLTIRPLNHIVVVVVISAVLTKKNLSRTRNK